MEILGFELPLMWTLLAGSIALIYIYGKRRNRWLRDYGFPGPEPDIYLGNLRNFFTKGFDLKDELRQQYGDVFGSWLGGIPFVNVADPDIIKEVLIKDFSTFSKRMTFGLETYPLTTGLFFRDGAPWKRLRTVSSPTFSASKLRVMCDGLNVCARKLKENLEQAAEHREIIELKKYFGAFTMDAIASTAFGVDIDSQSDLEHRFIKEVRHLVQNSFLGSPITILAMIFPGLTPLLSLLGFGAFTGANKKFFRENISKIITDRMKEPKEQREKRVDFLKLMLDAVDDKLAAEYDLSKDDSGKVAPKVTSDEVIGQVFLFFLAGYDTTSSALNFTAYCMAVNPDAQDKVVEEINSVIGDGNPDYDNVQKLIFLEYVIKESLRLYPVAPATNRYISKTRSVKGWTFPEGAYVNIPIISIHRIPEIYPEPSKFKPERWEKRSEINPMLYLPFGEGPRQCIGTRLAMMELKIALVHVLRKVRFVRLEDTPEGSCLGEGELSEGAVVNRKYARWELSYISC